MLPDHAGFWDAQLRRRAGRALVVLAPLLCLFGATASPLVAASDITIVTAGVTLSPSQTDYEAAYVEDTSPGGISVRVTTDNASGVILYVRCDDASPEVTLADLLVKCPTTGTLMGSYTPVTGSDQALWSVGSPVTDETVYTDVRIQNLWAYSDAGGGGTTVYMDALTYTVVEQ